MLSINLSPNIIQPQLQIRCDFNTDIKFSAHSFDDQTQHRQSFYFESKKRLKGCPLLWRFNWTGEALLSFWTRVRIPVAVQMKLTIPFVTQIMLEFCHSSRTNLTALTTLYLSFVKIHLADWTALWLVF